MSTEEGRPGIHRIPNAKKALEHLLGMCRGMVADRELNEREVLYLDSWLRENVDLTRGWPGDVLADQLSRVLADGATDADELASLTQTIDDVIGHADGATGGASTALCDRILPSQVVFPGRSFLFTGTVIGASRKKLKELVTTLGGVAAPDSVLFFADVRGDLPQLDYLIVGGVAARDWSHSSFGTKIQYAARARELGAPLRILNEETFWLAVRQQGVIRTAAHGPT